MLVLLRQHLLRRRLGLGVDVELSKVRVELLERLLLGLWIARVDEDGGEDVEGHEDEVDAGPDVGDGDGPDLADDDGAEGGARGGDAKALGAAV